MRFIPVAFVLVSCGSIHAGQLFDDAYVDRCLPPFVAVAMSKELEADVAMGARWWAEQAGVFHEDWEVELDLVVVVEFGKIPDTWLGSTVVHSPDFAAEIFINKDAWDALNGPLRQRLIRHELGHALGLKHDKNTTSVMFKSIERGVYGIDWRDIAVLEAIRRADGEACF